MTFSVNVSYESHETMKEKKTLKTLMEEALSDGNLHLLFWTNYVCFIPQNGIKPPFWDLVIFWHFSKFIFKNNKRKVGMSLTLLWFGVGHFSLGVTYQSVCFHLIYLFWFHRTKWSKTTSSDYPFFSKYYLWNSSEKIKIYSLLNTQR